MGLLEGERVKEYNFFSVIEWGCTNHIIGHFKP